VRLSIGVITRYRYRLYQEGIDSMTAAKGMRIAGWSLSALLGVLFIGMSAMMKFNPPPEIAEGFAKGGFTPELMFKIGIVEVICAVLFLIPWTGFLGAILLTGYLGGAVLTHVKQGEAPVMPIVIGVLVWVALGLRQSEIFALAMGKRLAPRAAQA
jgi:hypothetical protein